MPVTLAHYQILTAMLAPALFMTATASLIMSAIVRFVVLSRRGCFTTS